MNSKLCITKRTDSIDSRGNTITSNFFLQSQQNPLFSPFSSNQIKFENDKLTLRTNAA